ncbi:hypothetical protein [Spirosoma sp. 209]|uniref:hypothetical protein n=1 Tax=Spirosoma sp. 209 TaxID=1955701 RepID=UPI00098D2D6A|nr:hypothetical protein [Spirosoma sp. 209]
MEASQAYLWNRLTADPTYVAFHLARMAPVFAITPADLVCLVADNEKLIRLAACRVDAHIGEAWVAKVSQYTGIASETLDLCLVPMIQGYFDTLTMNE